MITQAFVLGAGLGTRLRPLTDELPKPLVPVFGKPLISFAFDHLLAAGCRRFIVNTHLHAACFAETFGGSVYRDVPLAFVHEPELLGTGGGIRNVLPQLADEPFIVYSGDILTDFALAPLIDEHFRSGNDVTLALRQTQFPPTVALRGRRVIDIGAKLGHAGDFDFANVSVWTGRIAERIPHAPGSFVPTLISAIKDEAKIGGVVVADGEWFNVGSPKQYLEVHRVIADAGWRPSYLAAGTEWPVRVSPSAMVDRDAKLTGFHAIAERARIGAGAELHDTIVWAGAQIASRTRLRNCIVRAGKTAQGDLSDTVI